MCRKFDIQMLNRTISFHNNGTKEPQEWMIKETDALNYYESWIVSLYISEPKYTTCPGNDNKRNLMVRLQFWGSGEGGVPLNSHDPLTS